MKLLQEFRPHHKKISRNIFSASNYVDHFSRRIYGLLRNAFIFNVIRRGFKGLSDTLFNLIRRDTQLARSLLIVKANLIRAFIPDSNLASCITMDTSFRSCFGMAFK